ncbi:hypothetical protein Bca4012_002155 [Brassica carinata]
MRKYIAFRWNSWNHVQCNINETNKSLMQWFQVVSLSYKFINIGKHGCEIIEISLLIMTSLYFFASGLLLDLVNELADHTDSSKLKEETNDLVASNQGDLITGQVPCRAQF